jgi:hypothetical protein
MKRKQGSSFGGSRTKSLSETPPAHGLTTKDDSSRDLRSRVQRILAARGLTLSEISLASRTCFGGDPRFFIPHNLYHSLGVVGFSPSIYQVFSLSRLSRYRFVDWLSVFGFRLDDIPDLQAILPAHRTVLLDSSIYDTDAWIPWFTASETAISGGSIAPLSQQLTVGPSRRVRTLHRSGESRFRYVKIGWDDAFAFPDLLPGSIVRVDPRPILSTAFRLGAETSKNLFLVELSQGLVCSRLRMTDKNRILLCSTHLPYAHVELELGKEARILGIADLELRPLTNTRQPEVPANLARFSEALPLRSVSSTDNLRDLLRGARQRSGLSFREASEKSRHVARLLRKDRYFCAVGSLSDYETMTTAPRHIHKIISLCVLYAVKAWDFMNAAGLRYTEAGPEPMPDDVLLRSISSTVESSQTSPPEFLVQAERDFEEFPVFLRNAGARFCGLPHLSLRDVFWLDGRRNSLHPYLSNAVLAVVNRRKKKPVSTLSSPLWAQPLFVLLARGGTYLCTSCSLEDETLVIRPFSDGFLRPVRFQNGVDIEVVGKVVTIVRRLVPNRVQPIATTVLPS